MPHITQWVEAEHKRADAKFIDDLIAANSFKSFLIGIGEDIPNEVLQGLSELVTYFNEDIREFQILGFNEYTKIAGENRTPEAGSVKAPQVAPLGIVDLPPPASQA